jgi:hypothetical protein
MRNCLKSLARIFTYFNLSAAFYAALWEQCVAGEICFMYLSIHKLCKSF